MTGGRGRIGRLLVDRLRGEGIRTISLARPPAAHSDDAVVDLRDLLAVSRIVDETRPDVVVHAASVLRGDDLAGQNELIDLSVARAVQAAQVPHTVFVSSAAVYGTAHAEARREDSATAPENSYGMSKLRGEQIFQQVTADRADASVLTLRVFNVAGPDFPDALVARLIAASKAAPVSLVAPDEFVRDYVHQSDLVSLLMASIAARHRGYRVLNAGAGVAVPTRLLIDSLAVPASSFVEHSGPPSVNWADMAMAIETLGVTPHALPTRAWAAPTLSAPEARSAAISNERID
ncbi:NAD-dependent epimerase/dehydratase family protein [Microbacterium sp.]|uniref:NAD-dependent epimerase/dehydratase family protein n=1 Tax=Microbacterium sp. TaxID=51671 RepID=UPI003A90F5BA